VKTTHLLSILVAAICLTSVSRAAETNIEVSIAIPKRNGKRVLEYSARSPHFHVIVANTSDKPQRIWREWCMWGYYALSFELTEQDGKTRTIKKKPRSWTKNFPDYWTVGPHESLVVDVEFADTSTWEGFPQPSGVSQSFTMRAVFEIPQGDQAQQHSVWTGRVVSKADEYVFYR